MGGATAIRPVDRFDATRFPCTVAAPVNAFLEAEDRRIPLLLAAAAELPALTGAGRIGVFIGAESGRGRMETLRRLVAAGGRPFDPVRFAEHARGLADALSPEVVSPAAPAVALARRLGAPGPVETVSLACASGLAAIVEAVRALRAGECDIAVAGGVGADVDPLMLAGFGKLQALSAHGVSRPFDRRRDGFVVGEGAALVVLGAMPGPVRVGGVGRSVDAVHLTMPDPTGRGAERAMRAAIAEATRADPTLDRLDVVQAHGTSTPLNDAVEAAALRRLGMPIGAVSSVKGALGHWIAGAGALGLVVAAASIAEGMVVPTAGLTDPDDDLPHVLGEGRRVTSRTALVNAFAFGGANVSVVLVAG
ncbi:MAG: beta-ketoacyl synthase N-terminal-like domain-containing protein [Pseudomonadota bacterium]|nr:beta-ketoacyl synthase N-terminal-like domain-containing protein [Pseudomonadota bacterium]